jgi:hypothetical protein
MYKALKEWEGQLLGVVVVVSGVCQGEDTTYADTIVRRYDLPTEDLSALFTALTQLTVNEQWMGDSKEE